MGPEFFESSFMTFRKDGKHEQKYSADSLIGKEISKAFGSHDEFMKIVFHQTMNCTFEKVAWLVYDRKETKLQFLTTLSEWQPNAEQFEPLLAYRIDGAPQE